MMHTTAWITSGLLLAVVAWGVWYSTRKPDKIEDALRDYRESGGGR